MVFYLFIFRYVVYSKDPDMSELLQYRFKCQSVCNCVLKNKVQCIIQKICKLTSLLLP